MHGQDTTMIRPNCWLEQIRHATTSGQLHVFAATCGVVGALHQLSTRNRTFMGATDVLVRLELVHRPFLQGRLLLVGGWSMNGMCAPRQQAWKMYVVQPSWCWTAAFSSLVLPRSTFLSEHLRMDETVRPSAWPHEEQMHNNRISGTSFFSLRFISSMDANSWQHLWPATLLSSARVASRVERSAGSIIWNRTLRKNNKRLLRQGLLRL